MVHLKLSRSRPSVAVAGHGDRHNPPGVAANLKRA
jgi:hypothetical protein